MTMRTSVIVLTLAARTAGVVTRAELRHSGLAGSTIGHQLRRGFLVRVWDGLYEVPELTAEATPLFRATKSVPGSVVSHGTAADLWGFPVPAPGADEPVHLTAPRSGPRSELPSVVLHRTRRRLEEADVGHPLHRLPATSPARTILDLAGTDIGDRRLAHVIETQIIAGRPRADDLVALLDHPGQRGVRGAARLRRLVGQRLDGQPIPGSLLERRFARLLRDHGIGGFERQVRPPWFEGRRGIVDLAHRSAAVIVEVDGRRWHTTTQAMADDRARDRVAASHGWLVLRVTADDLTDRPTRVAGQLTDVLARRLAPSLELAP